jgi:hypothetical protein
LIDDETVNHVAPILCGGQGLGKTRWIGRLVPEQLNKYFFSGTINLGNKDTVIQLSECMIIDLDELQNLTKKSIGDLKSLMTKQQIRVRRPYGKVAEKLPRRASFIGSINDKEFLRDTTGNRRFLCFDVDAIESIDVDLNMVCAQALHLYQSGARFWFNADETEEIEINNEQFKKSYYEEELLLNHFVPVSLNDVDTYLSTTEIARILNNREKLSVNGTTIQHLGKALASMKFIRKKHKANKKTKLFYENELYRKINWRTKTYRQRSEDKFLNNIENNFGEKNDIVIYIGDWSNKQGSCIKGAPTMGIGLKRLVAKKYTTLLKNI